MTLLLFHKGGSMAAETSRVMRVGIVGLGVASTVMLRELAEHPGMKVMAGADIRQAALDRFASEFGGETYRSAEELCSSPNIDLVYIFTPNRLHAQHAVIAAERGKQVILDKPMGCTLQECAQVVGAADASGVRLLVGHTQSLDAPIIKMAEIVRSGQLGRPLMINSWFYSDWLYRIRDAYELDSAQGEGLVMRQGPVQVDTARMIGGGMVRSVRATTFAVDPQRPIEGAYSAFLEFEGGASATLVYSGHGFFDSTEFTQHVGLGGRLQDQGTHLRSRRQIQALGGQAAESAHKESTRYGSPRAGGGITQGAGERWHAFFGMTMASCERGDIRQTREGLVVYGEDGPYTVPVPAGDDYAKRYTSWELDAMYDAWVNDAPLTLHNPRWGMATTEVCLAIHQSSREQREIVMAHQTPYQGHTMR